MKKTNMTNRNKRRANDKYIVELLRTLRGRKKPQVVVLPQGPFIFLYDTLWTTEPDRALGLVGNYSEKILKQCFRRCSPTSDWYNTMKNIEKNAEAQMAV